MADPTASLLQKAQQTGDFEAACKAVANQFIVTARVHAQTHKTEATEATWPPDLTYWLDCAARAKRARLIHAAEMATAREKAAERMRREGLEEFAQALESGEYASLGM